MVSSPIRFQAFLGRPSELEHLLERRAAAAKGRGGIVLVAGDPGIGKSRLVREFCVRLPRRTTKVARAAYREFAQRPLGPLLDVLSQLGAEQRPPNPNTSKDEFTAHLVEAFEGAASEHTTVVVLEDLHWADREAFEVLLAFAARAGSRRLLFVATYRDGEIVPSHPNFALLGRLLREDTVSLIGLDPLSERDLAELLRAAVLDRAALPAATVDGICRRADGNAFFAEELLRYAVDRHAAGKAVSPNSMPLSIHAAIAERVAACSGAARTLLSQASLFGRRFESTVVRAVFPGDEGTDGAAAFEELVRCGLLERVASGSVDLRFRHAISREIVYEEIPKDRARVLHLQIAEAIEARDDAGRHVESLAHHFWHADARTRALPYCTASGDAARALFAYAEACVWYERSARCASAPEDAGRALLAAAQAAVFGDRIDRALVLYEDARANFGRADRPDDVVIASVLTAATLYEQGSAGEATAVLEATRDAWSERATPLVRDRLLLRLGFLYAFTRRVEAAWQCLASIAAPVDLALAAEYHFLASSLHAQRAEQDAWRTSFERAFELFERSGAFLDNRRIALSNAALQASTLGDIASARDYQTRALEVARTNRSHAGHERVLLAQIELQTGDAAAARTGYDESESEGRFASRAERAILEAWLLQLFGDEAAPLPDAGLIEEASKGGNVTTYVRLTCAFAPLLDRQGRTREADGLFARAAARIETPFGATFAIAALAIGRPALALPVRAIVAEAAARPGDRVNRALLALLDASLAHAESPVVANARAREASQGFEAIGWHWLAAQAGELGGRRREALRFYRTIGATAQIRRLERSTMLRPNAEPLASILTPRERELAQIVAGGAGNRAAALQLSISEKAVEKYLTSIYAKLGISTRSQLAAYAAEIPEPAARQ